MAVTIPVVAPTDATPGAELLHTPPVLEVLSVEVIPWHNSSVPAIPSGDAFIVTTLTA
jgi:hypothetical protein